MKEAHVFVSVLMTAYNREAFIAEAIESVLASIYPYFELIIVDDCSIDNTVSIARSYAAKDSRIKLYINEQNQGDYRNRNKAASYANGKYIKYLDSDDMIMPWGLEVMVYGMECFPEAALGISSNQNENILYPHLLSSADVYRSYYYKNQLLSVGPTGTIIRREVFKSIGGFSGENYIGDTQLWFRLAQDKPVVCLPPGLVYWREHEGQQIVEERKNDLIELKRYELDRSILNDHTTPLSENERNVILQNLRNIKTRNALKDLIRGNLKRGFKKIQQFRIRISDILNALKRNQIVKNCIFFNLFI
jgi:glycosyltransferase involved in cell wall biosynthesis